MPFPLSIVLALAFYLSTLFPSSGVLCGSDRSDAPQVNKDAPGAPAYSDAFRPISLPFAVLTDGNDFSQSIVSRSKKGEDSNFIQLSRFSRGVFSLSVSSFKLKSDGMCLVASTSRRGVACDYYVFALRRLRC